MPNVRDAFFQSIYQHTRQGADTVIVSADLGAPSLDRFREDFGDRFINVGIAEQNLVAVAAGLALAGKKVIAYGLNPFPATRSLDYIRNLMDLLKIPVALAALNVGTCSAEAGYTHMPVEHLAILRTMHNVTLFTPSDETISEAIAKEAVFHSRPMYIQFDKQCSGRLYTEKEVDLTRGFVSSGGPTDIALITYGSFVPCAKALQVKLNKQGVSAKVIDCFALPLDERCILEELVEVKAAVCLEDGKVAGGLGSYILEILSDAAVCLPVKRFGLRFTNGYPQNLINRSLLYTMEGLTDEKLTNDILEYCRTLPLN